VPEIRVVGADGNQLGVMPTHQALQLARDQGLDLVVEIDLDRGRASANDIA